MADIKVSLELDNRQYQQALNNSEKAAEQFSSGVVSGMSKIGAAVEAITVKAGILFAAFQVIETIRSIVHMGDELDDLSRATGISVEKIAQLELGLMAAGGRADDSAKLIGKLQRELQNAREGSAQAQDALGRLGFTLKDMANMTPEEAISKTIEKLAAMENPIQRNALAFQLLGRSAGAINWEEVQQQTSQSTDHFEGFAQAVRDAGEVSDRAALAFKVFKEQLLVMVDPLLQLALNFEKFTKTAGAGDLVAQALKITFQTIAVVASDVAFVIDRMANGIVALVQAAGAAVTGDFAGAKKVFADYNTESEQLAKNLENFQKGILTPSEVPSSGKTPSTGSTSGGGGATFINASSAQVAAIRAVADAFALSNQKAIDKIKLDGQLIGASEEYRRSQDEILRIDQAVLSEEAKLNLEKARLTDSTSITQGAQRKAIDDTIKKIREQAETDKRATLEAVANAAQRKRSFESLTGALEIVSRAEEEIYKLQQSRGPFSQQEQIDNEAQITKRLEERRLVLDELKKMGKIGNLYDQGFGLLNDTAELKKGVDYFIEGLRKSTNLTDMQSADWEKLTANVKNQMDAIRLAEDALTKVKQDQLVAQHEFKYGWQDAFKKYADDANNAATGAGRVFGKVTQGLEDAFVNFAKTGKLSFSDLLNSITEELLRSQVKSLIANTFGLGGSGSTAGGGGDFLSTAWKGLKTIFGFANGGAVAGTAPILVGERGPEIFVPGGAGTVIPNSALGGGSVTYNINAVDAMSFRALLASDPSFLYAVTEQGRRTMPMARR